jgi:hypothetical protein
MSDIKTGERQEVMGQALVARTGELSISAAAARAKAEVEAAYLMAIHNRRNIDDARDIILRRCKNPRFAEMAIYHKPIGSGTLKGPSIRFAELAIQAMKNIRVNSNVVFEDESVRVVSISVTDLEQNLSYGKEVTLQKTVERSRFKPGQIVVGERENSNGQKVYIVKASEDELSNKVSAAESKVIRNCGLRLIPQDIIEEAMDECSKTNSQGGEDPTAATKRIHDAFSSLGIKPSQIEEYIGHPVTILSQKELEELRGIYQCVKDGEASWSDYLASKVAKKAEPERGTFDLSTLQPKEITIPGLWADQLAEYEKLRISDDCRKEIDRFMGENFGTTLIAEIEGKNLADVGAFKSFLANLNKHLADGDWLPKKKGK